MSSKFLFGLVVLLLLIPVSANAAAGTCSTTLRVITESTTSSYASTAHIIEALSSCPTIDCYHQRLYIDFSDKALYAAVLNAAATSTTVKVGFTTDMPSSKGSGFHGSGFVDCKLETMWFPP